METGHPTPSFSERLHASVGLPSDSAAIRESLTKHLSASSRGDRSSSPLPFVPNGSSRRSDPPPLPSRVTPRPQVLKGSESVNKPGGTGWTVWRSVFREGRGTQDTDPDDNKWYRTQSLDGGLAMRARRIVVAQVRFPSAVLL